MMFGAAATIFFVVFAIGAFCGAGPTRVSPNPFGFLFLGLAVLVWFAWKPMSAGLDQQGVFDAMSRNWMGLRDRKRGSENSN
jgi:hypothetical protein